MNSLPVVCDIEILHQKNIQYRQQIREDPGNLELRLGLAWCLFIQALHQAGRESILTGTSAVDEVGAAATVRRSTCLFDQDAYQLLKSSLHETFTVMQLSVDTQGNEDVAKLHALIQLSGANAAFDEAQAEAMRVFTRLLHDIATQSEQEAVI